MRRSRSHSSLSVDLVLPWVSVLLLAVVACRGKEPASPPTKADPLSAVSVGRPATTAPAPTGPTIRPAPALGPEIRRSLDDIRAADIIAHAKVLADPRFRGRQASMPGARKAAVYITDEFRKIGLRPGGRAGSYHQVFKIRTGYRLQSDLEFRVGGSSLGPQLARSDYAVLRLPGGRTDLNVSCALAGYGITCPSLKFDEYAGLDVKGKAVVVFSGVPWSPETARWLTRTTGNATFDTLDYKARNAAAHGARCLLIVDNPAGWRKQLGLAEQIGPTDTDVSTSAPIPVVHVTRALLVQLTDLSAAELRLLALEIAQERTPQSMLLRGRQLHWKAAMTGKARIGRNIVGVLPGRDEKLRRESIVIGAHYDHLGEGAEEDIFFGANDNAAGVGAVLAVARAFAALPQKPRRTVIFVAFDAEEIGRLGSKHYVTHPVLPIRDTVFMVNFDMIGKNEPNSINAVATRSSDRVHALHQEMNRHVGLRLVHPRSVRLGRSDHSPFYLANIPVMYLFGGLDDDYNTPEDTWDKLIPGKVEKVARLAFLTARAVAEDPARPTFRASEDSPFGPVDYRAR